MRKFIRSVMLLKKDNLYARVSNHSLVYLNFISGNASQHLPEAQLFLIHIMEFTQTKKS